MEAVVFALPRGDQYTLLLKGFYEAFGEEGLTEESFPYKVNSENFLRRLIRTATTTDGPPPPAEVFISEDHMQAFLFGLTSILERSLVVPDGSIHVGCPSITVHRPKAAILKVVLRLMLNLFNARSADARICFPPNIFDGYVTIVMYLERYLGLGDLFELMDIAKCDKLLEDVRILFKTEADGTKSVYMAHLLPDNPYQGFPNNMMVFGFSPDRLWEFEGFFAPSPCQGEPGYGVFEKPLNLSGGVRITYDDISGWREDRSQSSWVPEISNEDEPPFETLAGLYVSCSIFDAAHPESSGDHSPKASESVVVGTSGYYVLNGLDEEAAADVRIAVAAEKAAAEKATRKAASMKAASEKAAAERAAAEERAAAKKAAAERAAAEKAATEATTEEKAAAGGGATAEEVAAAVAPASRTQPRRSAGHSGGGVAGCEPLYHALERVAKADLESPIPEALEDLDWVIKAIDGVTQKPFETLQSKTRHDLLDLLVNRPPRSDTVIQLDDTLVHLDFQLRTVEELGLADKVPQLPATIKRTRLEREEASRREDDKYVKATVAATHTIFAAFENEYHTLKRNREDLLAEAVTKAAAFANKCAKTSDA